MKREVCAEFGCIKFWLTDSEEFPKISVIHTLFDICSDPPTAIDNKVLGTSVVVLYLRNYIHPLIHSTMPPAHDLGA